jgi:hypothetical protein
VGEGLDRDGTLQDLDLWPDDPLTRDVRFRLASVRAAVGTRWSLNDDLAWQPGVARDVERLATQEIPVAAWPSVAGWDDSARRLALRHHRGLLRILSELLRRGLDEGIMDIPQSTIDEWRNELVARRRECADGALAIPMATCSGSAADSSPKNRSGALPGQLVKGGFCDNHGAVRSRGN